MFSITVNSFQSFYILKHKAILSPAEFTANCREYFQPFFRGHAPRRGQRCLAHELGHAVLHRKYSELRAFHDFELFDETSTYEYEANIFAAEYLLNDDEVLELLNEDLSFFSAARMLHVPPELLDFKFRVLKRRGYALNSPICTQSDFLKHI